MNGTDGRMEDEERGVTGRRKRSEKKKRYKTETWPDWLQDQFGANDETTDMM